MPPVVEFTLDHKPVPASRPKITRTGLAFYPKSHEQYKQFLLTHLKEKPCLPSSGVVEARFLFLMEPYKTSDYPTHRSDLDNLSKLPADCMTKCGSFWVDDNLIVGWQAYKMFTPEGVAPHTKVRVEILDEDPNEYAWRKFYE
jgi:Holliday junction resolvase RusA-like endonuclease